MDKRKRIGIVFVFNESWLGGVYYIYNILKALCLLDDSKLPVVDVYCDNETVFEKIKCETHYPYLCFNEYKENYLKRIIWSILMKLNYKVAHWVRFFKFNPEDVFVYPFFYGSNVQEIYWCPDFQEKYLPENFSEEDVKGREKILRYVGNNSIPIVFSSEACLNDFKKFYPTFINKTFVLRFAVVNRINSNIKIGDILDKYNIPPVYFICANQFWKHKNHLFLFKAFRKAINMGLNAHLVCTGNFSDYRNPDYIQEIEKFLHENNKDNRIRLLGMIDKNELMCLIDNSFAVIQPSLFEGWNTTVEDCKALNKFIFLSDLPVHHEQIERNVCFFDPFDEDALAAKLVSVKPTSDKIDYNANIRDFGQRFIDMMGYVSNNCRK